MLLPIISRCCCSLNALSSLVQALEYDATFAIIAEQVQPQLEKVDLLQVLPMRFGSDAHIPAIKREFATLGARFALISTITRFEGYVWRLLHHRYVVEGIAKHPGEPVGGPEYRSIRKAISREMRKGIATVLGTEVIRQPSSGLTNAIPWLAGLLRVRNCLMHRGGVVQLEDTDEDSMTISWIETVILLSGQKIEPPHVGGGQIEVRLEMTSRSWKVGEMIHLTPRELQDVAFALARVAQGLEEEFEAELLPIAKEIAS